MSKKPIHKETPPGKKYPRGGEKATGIIEPISWHIRTIDQEGSWGWKRITGLTLWKDILSKMSSFETMEWSEILNRYSHSIPISKLCSNARKRLEEIQQDDIDEIVSLRLTGEKRIWGIRDRNILKIIWWDPEHTVCPSNKKYT